jgi:threonine dehydratase
VALVGWDDVLRAAERLAGVAHRTPVLTSRGFDQRAGCRAFLKGEHLQRAGAFKFRGAYHRVAEVDPAAYPGGVVAYSSGNHAQAVALAARLRGLACTVCMPTDAPRVKVEATRELGAEVVFYDRFRQDRVAFAQDLARARGLALVPPFDDPLVIAGQGTVALELCQEVSDLDALVVPVGGGGLISGCAVAAKALRPGLRVIGVETEGADDARRSLAAGHVVEIPPPATIADGIRTVRLGELTWEHVRVLVDDVVVVSDQEVLAAMRLLALRLKQVVEPTGAVAAAAVLAGRVPGLGGRRVGVVLSGGNVDPAVLAQALAAPEG